VENRCLVAVIGLVGFNSANTCDVANGQNDLFANGRGNRANTCDTDLVALNFDVEIFGL
jgi:hypothetical protein